MYCVKCGAQAPDGTRFCRACGAAMPVATAVQYAAPAAAVPEVRYAGFWRRVVAALIDLVIVVPVWIGLSGLYEVPAATILERSVFAPDGVALSRTLSLLLAGRWLLLVLLVFVYYALMEATRRGASLGKRVMRLRVTGLDGGRVGIGRSVARTALKPLSALPLNIGYLMAGLTRRKQALHDLMSGALVVRK